MTDNKQPLGITDVILRDAHQSILATRMRLDDMLPIAGKLDQVGFWKCADDCAVATTEKEAFD